MMLSVGLLLCAVMTLTEATSDPGPCYDRMDAGPCDAFPRFPHFYYNYTSKTCEEFVFGGCHTTRNNFLTREQCVEECVPKPDDSWCLVPVRVGSCNASIPRWHFNTSSEKCEPFVYGGCGANENNFPTEQACVGLCGHLVITPAFRRILQDFGLMPKP